ncbi:vacuolar import/degradation protein Vid24, partial [Dimargaris cristalligena]
HLYPGSRFVGYQRNIQHDHRVEVDIQFADLKQSYLCGYLTIYNLTSKLPVLTTFFEAEIIGERHSFSTRKWNSNFRNDLEHWNKFPDFAEFEAVANQDRPIPNILGHPTIFMRWKEIFLAPNHRVTHIDGASFEGFYFIQYQQSTGDITGYYYHAESEKYQLLTLSHVCNNAVPYFEFS